MPEVAVLAVTWNRPTEIARTWKALKEHLHYPSLTWAVADDHSPDEVLEFIKAELQPDAIYRTRKRSGVGTNVNNALKRLAADFVFVVEDDRVLKTDIYLLPAVDILSKYEEFGMVRYGGIAGHDVTCRLRELDGPFPYAVWDRANPRYQVWELLKKESRFLYVYSGEPHLKHRRFHDAYGWYIEGHKLGTTEDEFAHRFVGMEGPGIICFPEFVTCYWDHIGQSRQLTEDDIGKGY